MEEKSSKITELSIAESGLFQPCLPLDMGRFFYYPDGKIYCVIFKASAALNAPPSMAEMIRDLGGKILSVYFYSLNDEEIVGFAFIDMTASTHRIEELKERINENEFFKKAYLILPSETGFIADVYFFPINVAGERAVIFRKTVYQAFFSEIRERFGTAGEVFLYYVGFDSGKRVFETYKKLAGSENIRDLAAMARAMGVNFGWCIPELISFDKDREWAIVRIHNNFECKLGSGNKPYSQFFRGLIAGVFSKILNKDVKVEEVKCTAKGDPYCEFEITSK